MCEVARSEVHCEGCPTPADAAAGGDAWARRGKAGVENPRGAGWVANSSASSGSGGGEGHARQTNKGPALVLTPLRLRRSCPAIELA